jgi:signal transduction histidine kinase
MSPSPDNSLDILLAQAQVVGIELDAGGALLGMHNPSLLAAWLGEEPVATLPANREALFEQLFGPRSIRVVLDGLERLGVSARLELGILPGRLARAGAPERQFRVTLQKLASATLLVLQDESKLQLLLQELQDTRARCETALAVLRAPPDGLRLFLGSASASVHAIRATLRMPARTQEALRDKLGRLHTEAAGLANEAAAIGLTPVVESCQSLVELIAALHARDNVSGDELLPLAPRVDLIASAIGNSARIEEQRHEVPPAAAEQQPQQQRPRRSSAWHDVSERRWSEFLRRHGEQIGILARLGMTGAQQVPPQHRRHVDEILQHMLKNALDHGIETPEDRLAAGKSAAGRISVGFSLGENGTLKMTVHDDGRGFDISRIGKAAVQSGLLSEESLARRDAGDLVGLIFKPTFTTEGLEDGARQGRGMAYLRRKVTRLGGQISVATKPARYTLFTVELPESEAADDGLSLPQAMP